MAKRARRGADVTPNENEVSFSVKELFNQLNTKLDQIVSQLSTKAEKGDLTALTQKVELLEKEGSSQARDALAELRVQGKEFNLIRDRVLNMEQTSATKAKVEENYTRTRWLILGFAVSSLVAAVDMVMMIIEFLKH